MTTPRPALGRLTAEFFVIVLGVLTALAADAWWQERQESRQYKDAVAALITDVDENLEALATQRGTMEAWTEGQTDALRVIRSPESHSRRELEGVLLALFRDPVVIVLDGSLDAVRETVVWSRLPAQARTLVSRIPETAEAALTDAVAMESTIVRANDLMMEYGGFQGLLSVDLFRGDIDLVVRRRDGDIEGLIRDARLEHMVLGWVFLIANAERRLDDVVDELERLRDILQVELDG